MEARMQRSDFDFDVMGGHSGPLQPEPATAAETSF
jgi:hypothetical protein